MPNRSLNDLLAGLNIDPTTLAGLKLANLAQLSGAIGGFGLLGQPQDASALLAWLARTGLTQ